MSAPSMVRRRRPPLSADGQGRGLPAMSPTRRCRRSKRVAENAGIDGNEVLECSRVTGKSLAEIAEIPCKYFARETVRSFTVSLWGQTKRGYVMRYPPSGRCAHAVAAKLGRKSLLTDSIGQADTPALTLLDLPQFKPATMFHRRKKRLATTGHQRMS